MDSVKTVFVLGAPRSGTSMILYMLINGQPTFVGSKHESQFYTIALKKPFVESTFLKDEYFKELLGEDVIKSLFSESKDHFDFFNKAMDYRREKDNAPVFVEKSPMHTVFYKDLPAKFPDVGLVLINRHPAANIQSIAFTKWINLLSDKFPFGLNKNKYIRYVFASLLFHEYWKDSKKIEKDPRTLITICYEDVILEKIDLRSQLSKAFGFEFNPLYVSRPFSNAVSHTNEGYDRDRVSGYKQSMPKSIQYFINAVFTPRKNFDLIFRIPFLLFFFEPVYLIKKHLMGKK
jgi:Sulfotransferase family